MCQSLEGNDRNSALAESDNVWDDDSVLPLLIR